MVPDAPILQPVLSQGKQLLAELPVLGRGRAPICSRHMDSVPHNGVGQKPVSTDIPPRVLHSGGNGLECDVTATGGTDGSIAHLHGGGVDDAVQDISETVVSVHTNVSTAGGRMVVEACCGAIRLAQSVVGRRAGDDGGISGPSEKRSVGDDAEDSLVCLLTSSVAALPWFL